MSRLWVLLLTAVIACTVLACVVMDLFIMPAMRLPWPVLAAALLLGGALLAFAVTPRRRWETRTVCAGAAVVLVAVALPWHPRKRFVFDLYRVRPAMTVDEVEDVLGGYMKGSGPKWQFTSPEDYESPRYPTGPDREDVTGAMIYRWNDTDGAYDSDWGEVTFERGRVTSVRFLAD